MPDQDISITDPDLKRLYDYWLSKRGKRIAPTRTEMNPADVKFILPYMYSLDVVGLPHRFRFRLAGSQLEQAYGGELTGKFLDEIDLDQVGHLIVAEYESVVKNGQPISTHRDFTKDSGRYLKYDGLILPISSDGNNIDMLFGAIRMRGAA